MRQALLFALIGAAAGLLAAQFLPSLGKSGLDKGFSDLAFELGAKRPYLLNAAVGAAIGAVIGGILGKK
jgi:hypothetical protein